MPVGFSKIAGKMAAEVTSPAVLEDAGFGRSVESILPEVVKIIERSCEGFSSLG